MKTFADCSEVITTTDTVEVSMGKISLSAKAKRIIGVWAHALGGAGLTTLENTSGIVRLSSPDFDIAPFRFPIASVAVLTTGGGPAEARILPVNIPCTGKADVEGFITMDMVQAIHPTARFGLIYEGD